MDKLQFSLKNVYSFEMLKVFLPIVLFSLASCAFNRSEILKQEENFTNFFLCFPELDLGFSQLTLEDQMKMRKKVEDEKKNRKFDCSEFSNFVAAKEVIDNINKETLSEKYEPCKRVNLSTCEAR